jgi:uncharacterized protein YcnI
MPAAPTPRPVRRAPSVIAGVAFVAAVLVATASAAAAHIAPSPPAAQAGTTATISFEVEHGCGDQATTALAIQVPDGVTAVQPGTVPGWSSVVQAGVVEFSGGPLPATTPGAFPVTLTLPSRPGTVYFKIVQTCGSAQLSWVQLPAGSGEPEYPAAAVKVTAGTPTAEDLAPPADDEHHDDSSNTGWYVGGAAVVVAAVVVVAGLVVVRRRRSTPP